jgi:cytochrome c oxidase cbb3-type subunit 4
MTPEDWTMLLGALTTVVAFVAFIGIVAWAWSRRNKKRFAAAAREPFALPDELDVRRDEARARQRSKDARP